MEEHRGGAHAGEAGTKGRHRVGRVVGRRRAVASDGRAFGSPLSNVGNRARRQRDEGGGLDAQQRAKVAAACEQWHGARRTLGVDDERKAVLPVADWRHGAGPIAKGLDALARRGEAHLLAERAARGERHLDLARQLVGVELPVARKHSHERRPARKDCERLDRQARRLRALALARADERGLRGRQTDRLEARLDVGRAEGRRAVVGTRAVRANVLGAAVGRGCG